MVKTYKKIVQYIEKKRGPIAFFAVLTLDDLIASTAIVMAADWVNKSNVFTQIDFLDDVLRKYLDNDELSTIMETRILSTDSDELRPYRCYNTDERILDPHINGFDLLEGYVVYSRYK